ncbi:MAG TPA: STAS/SEC14 domain-containing protein [Verrucomicrobiae bacterium]|nr:STAS/SEC14 domain-containing protein [Verrucomicrobiae bacterium]
MAIKLEEKDNGKLVEMHLSGKLTREDYEHFVPEIERLVRDHGKLHLLVDMQGFHGWTAGALWEDLKFDVRHFSDIERVAMVGEKKWQKGMSQFCRPFTAAKLRYFDHAEMDAAREWAEAA